MQEGLKKANEQIYKVQSSSKLSADVTVLRWDTAQPGPQRGLLQTHLGQFLVLMLGANSLPSLCCSFLLCTVRKKTTPRTVSENHLGSWLTLLVLSRSQVLDL